MYHFFCLFVFVVVVVVAALMESSRTRSPSLNHPTLIHADLWRVTPVELRKKLIEVAENKGQLFFLFLFDRWCDLVGKWGSEGGNASTLRVFRHGAFRAIAVSDTKNVERIVVQATESWEGKDYDRLLAKNVENLKKDMHYLNCSMLEVVWQSGMDLYDITKLDAKSSDVPSEATTLRSLPAQFYINIDGILSKPFYPFFFFQFQQTLSPYSIYYNGTRQNNLKSYPPSLDQKSENTPAAIGWSSQIPPHLFVPTSHFRFETIQNFQCDHTHKIGILEVHLKF